MEKNEGRKKKKERSEKKIIKHDDIGTIHADANGP